MPKSSALAQGLQPIHMLEKGLWKIANKIDTSLEYQEFLENQNLTPRDAQIKVLDREHLKPYRKSEPCIFWLRKQAPVENARVE